jgi:ATP-dependent DNA helicase RecG
VLSRDDAFSVAGLLLVGLSDAIRERAPHAQWQFFRMLSDTDYDQADSGYDCITVALRRLRDLINASNPIVTFKGDLVHPEFPRYPHVALRELLVNAFVHRDYQAHGSVFVKLYPNRLEITNPGAFLGGITPENILHHESVPRYGALFGAVTRMRLANAANLGVPRVFREFLCEGKEPPHYWTPGQSVRAIIRGQEPQREFFDLVKTRPELDVDELLVLHYLTRHREISTRRTAELCCRPISEASECLARLLSKHRLLEMGGTGRGRYYRLSRSTYEQLGAMADYDVDKRLSREHVKARILAILEDRGLSNAEIREVTQMDRNQTFAFMRELQEAGLAKLEGKGRFSKWTRTRSR